MTTFLITMLTSFLASVASMSPAAIMAAAIAAIPTIIGLASIIVKITKTKRDDYWLAKVIKVLEVFSLAKATPAVVRADITDDELADIIDAMEDASAQTDYRRSCVDDETHETTN